MTISACEEVAPAAARAGQGRVSVERRAAGGSVVTRAFATSPLRLLTPRNHGGAAWVYTSSYGGGLVDGDHLDFAIEVGSGAAAYVSTQASTKVYRSPRGTSSLVSGRVAAGGLLVVAPDPVVPFAGARYRQRQRFEIADGGALVVTDTVASGRHASGERWAFDEYHSLLEITTGGRLAMYDPIRLRQEDGSLVSRFGRFNALAVAIVVGHTLRDEAERLVLDVASQRLVRKADLVMTAAPIADAGCLIRLAGVSLEQVGRTLRELLRFVPERLGDDPWRRKW